MLTIVPNNLFLLSSCQEKRLSELKADLDRKLDEEDRAKQQRSAQVQNKMNAAKKARKEAADAIAYVFVLNLNVLDPIRFEAIRNSCARAFSLTLCYKSNTFHLLEHADLCWCPPYYRKSESLAKEVKSIEARITKLEADRVALLSTASRDRTNDVLKLNAKMADLMKKLTEQRAVEAEMKQGAATDDGDGGDELERKIAEQHEQMAEAERQADVCIASLKKTEGDMRQAGNAQKNRSVVFGAKAVEVCE